MFGQGIDPPDLPDAVTADCQRPETFLTDGTRAGVSYALAAMGNELIACNAKRNVAVTAYAALASVARGEDVPAAP